MTIVLLVLLGISFLCALTLVGACMVSARSRSDLEEIMPVEEYDAQPTLKSAAPLHTTSSSVV